LPSNDRSTEVKDKLQERSVEKRISYRDVKTTQGGWRNTRVEMYDISQNYISQSIIKNPVLTGGNIQIRQKFKSEIHDYINHRKNLNRSLDDSLGGRKQVNEINLKAKLDSGLLQRKIKYMHFEEGSTGRLKYANKIPKWMEVDHSEHIKEMFSRRSRQTEDGEGRLSRYLKCTNLEIHARSEENQQFKSSKGRRKLNNSTETPMSNILLHHDRRENSTEKTSVLNTYQIKPTM
jgi:hypothetical protein